MEKLKEIIKKSLVKTYWVETSKKFENSSEYPQEFEQRFGNTSVNTIVLDEYLINSDKIDVLHNFLRGNGFDTTQQYKINDYSLGFYYNENRMIMLRCAFGNPDKKIEDDTEDENNIGVFDTHATSIAISFCPLRKNKESVQSFLYGLIDLDILFIPNLEKNLYMIAQDAKGLFKQKTSFNNIEIKDEKYELYYGDGFPHDKILDFFDSESDNLMLFYGIPGSGKTNYIKNLILKADQDIIYVPPSMVNIIAEPSFVTFMLQNQGSVLIIEDAEQILCNERSSATTNILNLTDGFLKDALKLKIIATMNADISGIDTALTRKGRLHLSHHFDKLSIENANRLAQYCDIEHTFDEETALCDIFNCAKFSSPLKREKRSIGFV